MFIKRERGLLLVILLSLAVGAGLLVFPQSGLAEGPYSIKKAESSGESADETVTFKAVKPEMAGSSQEEIKEESALKVYELIPRVEEELKPALQALTEAESSREKLIEPKFELRAEPMDEKLTEPGYRLHMEPVEIQTETPKQREIKMESLEPVVEENNIPLKEKIKPLEKHD